MITLFKADEMDFSHNGIGSLDKHIIEPVVEEQLNGLFAFTFKYPVFAPYGLEIDGQSVVRVPTPDGNQLFRVYRPVKTMGYVEVSCYHIFYDLVDNFIEDTNIVEKDGLGALIQLGGATQFAHRFTFFSDINRVSNSRIVRINPVAALLDSGQDNSFISRWGGELKRNNFQVRMMNAIGTDRGVTIRHKKDLLGYEADIDYSTPVTRIMPMGFDGLPLPEKYVDSPLINNYVQPKIQEIEYRDIKAAIGDYADDEDAVPLETAYQMLRDRAAEEFSIGKIDIPAANYKVEFVPLAQTEEYKDFQSLETILIGDTVTVIHYENGFFVKAKMIHYKYDPLGKKYISIELGNYKESFSNTNKIYQAIDKRAKELEESTLNYIQTAANGKNTVYRGPDEPDGGIENDIWFKTVGDGEVEMYIHDGLVWRLEAYSAGNLGGTLNAALVNVINLNANSIVAGAMSANRVRTGLLSSTNAVSTLDLDNGKFTINHTDGSYTQMSADGFKRYTASDNRNYHYLIHLVSYQVNAFLSWIQLPDEFKGKQFQVFTAISDSMQLLEDNTGLTRIVNKVNDSYAIDYANARVPIQAYRMVTNFESRVMTAGEVQGILIAVY
ncbi:phage tail spike protein [Neobacillus niacini]|uniref:phage tail spike protein n=1 Tax=Neobacillus niacini TaxID=86668 RepID=UPI002FFDF331